MRNKTKKYIAFFVLFFIISGFAVGALPQPAKAQWITSDIPSLVKSIWDKLKDIREVAIKQIGATAFKKALSTFLNKLAYDSAVYVASGGPGQQGLINPFSKKALDNLGDAVAGQLIDDLAMKSGFSSQSLCEPIDLTTKVNLLMSFKKPKEPALPKCSLSAMRKNAQDTFNDDLLELNANFKMEESSVTIASEAVTDDQALAGTQIQTALTLVSNNIRETVNEYQGITIVLSTKDDIEIFDEVKARTNELIIIEASLEESMQDLVNIMNQANECYNKFSSNPLASCGSPECVYFGPLVCDKAAQKANQYGAELIGVVGKFHASVKDLNKKIASGAFVAASETDVKDITNVFNPEANALGQFTGIQSALSDKQQKELEAEKLKTLSQGPCKGLETPISGDVKTPSSVVCNTLNQGLEKSTKAVETYTGQIVADAFGIFINTLTAKVMDQYFKKGLSMVFNRHGTKECKGGKDICGDGGGDSNPDKTEDLLTGGTYLGGKSAAEKSFGGFLSANLEAGGQQDILSILASCPPEQPLLNNCIIDESFRRAIEKQYTLKEAVEAYKSSGGSDGLDPKRPFGYILVGGALDEPDYKNGYPYRSMLYLRKYRIIPIGWELAAQYIKDIESPKQVHTLDDVINGFDDFTSPFFGLVDPSWVLKSPQVFCVKQGAGPELISSELQCEKFAAGGTGQCENDDYQSRKVSRQEWCADEQTCLEEGESGDCKRYGYCTLENPSWKLGGTQCNAPYASCEGYTNTITKANYSILESTLVKNGCNAGNAGCSWYCQDAQKMCQGGTRAGQPCSVNNDCLSIYCSVGTCTAGGTAAPGSPCSYDADCGGAATCDTAVGSRTCINGDNDYYNRINKGLPTVSCNSHSDCGRGVINGFCEEGGVWSCLNTGTCSNPPFASCTKATEIADCGAGNVCSLTGDRINLDRDVKKCEAKNAGCNQFIKVAPGTNLIGNSGFEDDIIASATINRPSISPSNGYLNKWYLENVSASDADMKASIDNTIVHSGKNSLYIEMDSAPNGNNQGLWMSDSTRAYSVVPTGFILSSEKTYTVSAWIYNRDADDANSDDDPDSVIMLGFGNIGAGIWSEAKTNQLSPQWERMSVTIPPGANAPDQIRIYPTAGPNPIRFYIDDLQLEESDTANSYTQYGSSNQMYLNGQRISCTESEVGCNFYSPVDGGDPIPAIVKAKDSCPTECAGYAPFYQFPSFFETSADVPNIIPSTAASCPASAVGCEEFTNLDTVASGGEAKEYYTKLRQCAKPGTTTEATYYTWEGSEEAGFQLRAWILKADSANGNRPYSTNGVDCLDAADPDCRIFYDQNGVIFSEELSSTIFISADCHPLRRTIQGTRDDCEDSGGRSEPAGVNPLDIVTCYYDVIPSQGAACPAQYAGCREYRGSAGNNLRMLMNDDFEGLTSQDWTPSNLSSESIAVGGRSYRISYSDPNGAPGDIDDVYMAKKNVSDLMMQDKVYILEFWAKRKNSADNSAALNARFTNSAAAILPLQNSRVAIDIEWKQYSLGPLVFNRAPANDGTETLEIFPAVADDGSSCNPGLVAGCIGEYYLDNIVLREITDNPYLIKNSWKIPLSCDLDPTDPAYVSNALEADLTAAEVGVIDLYNSGGFPNALAGGGTIVIDGEAIKYTDSGGGNLTAPLLRGVHGTTAVAHSKDAIVQLLDEGAQLGCKNYTDRIGKNISLRSFDKLCGEDKVGCTKMFNTYNSRSIYDQTIKGEYIPRDSVEYMVDNPKLYCDLSFKGCDKLGLPALEQDGSISSWENVYLINDPDQYDTIACTSDETMCSEFVTRTGGTTYFKDPKDTLCEYHSSINIEGTITKGWFKKEVIPAALFGLVFYDSDGDAIKDSYANPECATTAGVWDETKWTYSCPNDQAGCTEYQAPLTNILKTADQHIFANCSTGCAIGLSGASIQVVNSSTFKYRFDILEEGDYELTLSTQNFASGASEPSSFGQLHELDIYVDGILKKQLNGASTPSAPLATSVSAQITPAIKLGNLGRGQRIITIHWPAANDWCAPIGVGGCPNSNSNLQLNYLVIGKSAGAKYYNLEQGVDTASCMGVIDPEKGCVAFYDATNPSLSINSSAVSGNAFAPAACQKCSKADSCDSLPTCDPTAGNCCCNNTAVITSPCDANTILKVRADRQCAEWLACTDSEQVTDSKGNLIEMCKARKACRKVGDGVECASDGWIDEIKQNQTFDNPLAIDVSPAAHASVIADAALRSGYFKAGVHWAKACRLNMSLSCQVDSDCGVNGPCDDQVKAVSNNIEGYYPYATYDSITGFGGMTPRGALYDDPGTPTIEKIIAFEDDFEAYQSGQLLPQCSVSALQPGACTGDNLLTPAINEDTCVPVNAGICLNYWQSGLPKATNKEFKFGGQALLVLDGNVGGNKIVSKNIFVNNTGNYVFTVWLNTKDLQGTGAGALNRLIAEVDSGGIKATAFQEESKGWKKYVIPFTAGAGTANVQIYMQNMAGGNPIKVGSKAYADMISLAPVLELQSPIGGESYSDRSCRIYAKPDALACKYRERNTGREIQGWRGFCAEADPKNPDYCLQWWPIDLIEGEDISKF